MKDEIYNIIQVMRKAKDDYCTKHGLEGSFFCADITIYETDSGFTQALRRVDDFEQGFARWWNADKENKRWDIK